MTKLTNAHIAQELTALVNRTAIGTRISWKQIGDTVRERIPANGWLQVRNVMQSFMNDSVLVRAGGRWWKSTWFFGTSDSVAPSAEGV